MLTQQVKNFANFAYRIDTELLYEVNVSLMTDEEVSVARQVVEPKQCYHNSFRLCSQLGYRFVFGIVHNVIPIEHAWLLTPDDRFVDPTLELVLPEEKFSYYSLIDLHFSEVMEIAEKTGYPPMASTLRQFDKYHFLFKDTKQKKIQFPSTEVLA